MSGAGVLNILLCKNELTVGQMKLHVANSFEISGWLKLHYLSQMRVLIRILHRVFGSGDRGGGNAHGPDLVHMLIKHSTNVIYTKKLCLVKLW